MARNDYPGFLPTCDDFGMHMQRKRPASEPTRKPESVQFSARADSEVGHQQRKRSRVAKDTNAIWEQLSILIHQEQEGQIEAVVRALPSLLALANVVDVEQIISYAAHCERHITPILAENVLRWYLSKQIWHQMLTDDEWLQRAHTCKQLGLPVCSSSILSTLSPRHCGSNLHTNRLENVYTNRHLNATCRTSSSYLDTRRRGIGGMCDASASEVAHCISSMHSNALAMDTTLSLQLSIAPDATRHAFLAASTAAWEGGFLARACDILEAGVRAHPKEPKLWVALGLLHKHVHKHRSAADVFRVGLAECPDSVILTRLSTWAGSAYCGGADTHPTLYAGGGAGHAMDEMLQ